MRDHSLDLLKGAACVLMLFAHTGLQVDLPSKALTFLGGFAPILFFAVSGITADLQARRYPAAGFLLSYAMIFALGLSFVAVVSGNFWTHFQMDILQIIAVGVLTLFFVQRTLRPGLWFHLAAAVGVFALKIATDRIPRDEGWVGTLENVVLEPGNFVLVPWLFPFFLGIFCYRVPNRGNLGLALAALVVLAAMKVAGIPLEVDNRWDMSLGFFTASLLFTSAAFYVARRLCAGFILRGCAALLWLGRQSLVFLYVHIGLIWLVREYAPDIASSYLIWPLVAVGSVVMMRMLPGLLEALRLPETLSQPSAWGVLLALILLVPLALPPGAALVGTELALGIVFSLYYPSIMQRLKTVSWRPMRSLQES
jgi:hypothetical protein